jgi:tRNA modification GTPase
LHQEISDALAQAGRGERLRDGLVVAIAGPPNAGKSTLLNRIAKREVAIVSPQAGTTRDVIEVHLDLGGYPVTLLDTAGVRETDDPVEQEGVRRARERAAAADLVLWITESGGPMADTHGQRPTIAGSVTDKSHPLTDARNQKARGTKAKVSGLFTGPMAESQSVWTILNKVDLQKATPRSQQDKNDGKFISISATRGDGVDVLLARLEAHVRAFFGSESGLIARARHRYYLTETLAALQRALGQSTDQEEIIAEELRLASRALGRLTGKVDVEDILDVIFRDFCIGK